MELSEALEIVSYKLALKLGEDASDDPVLLPEVIQKAIADQADDTIREIDVRSYMTATKLVNEFRKEHNRLAGEKWLADNAKKDGVVTKETGLQYRVIKQGKGKTCKSGDGVEVDYEGTLIDGSVFDSSFEREKTAFFGVDDVIRGWQEGLKLMNEGSKYQFFIPQELAYGERGTGSDIPAYAVLIFEVTLRSIC